MIIALATPRVAPSIEDGLDKIDRSLTAAATGLLAARYAPERYQDAGSQPR